MVSAHAWAERGWAAHIAPMFCDPLKMAMRRASSCGRYHCLILAVPGPCKPRRSPEDGKVSRPARPLKEAHQEAQTVYLRVSAETPPDECTTCCFGVLGDGEKACHDTPAKLAERKPLAGAEPRDGNGGREEHYNVANAKYQSHPVRGIAAQTHLK